MSIESEITGNRTMYYSRDHSSNRIDQLVDKVRGIKRGKNGSRPRVPRNCEVCCEEFTKATRFCSQSCFYEYLRLTRKCV